ncbi:MAG TPA: undecaprenyl-phosphate glucose phosphotransferase [Bacteroidota bacterium]|nr:undecaprenyl-phosphate glucose phosphotransferase [Bacteroidota bacterium]
MAEVSSSRRGDILLPLLSVLSDGIAIEAAFLFSYAFRFRTTLFTWLGFHEEIPPPFENYLLTSIVVVGVWLLLLQSRQMYRTRRNVILTDELLVIFRVVSFGMLLLMGAAFMYRQFSYSRSFVAILWATSIAFLFIGRTIINVGERALYRRGIHLQRAIILGTSPPAPEVFLRLHRHASFGFNILGYFAKESSKDEGLRNASWLGPLAAAPDFIRSHDVERVFIAVPHEEKSALMDLVHSCEGMNVEFMMVPDMLDQVTSHVHLNELEGIPFLRLKGIPFTPWGRITKRAFDLAVSSVLMLFFLPLFALIALAVKLSSRGPIFFRQQRLGLDGRLFTMHKFRSMRVDAEQQTGPVWAKEHDPRRTAIGVLLRKTSMDELPQLFDVFRGDMSLVGPRPERPFFVDQFKHLVPQYLDRHRVKAGMTGWAQVNGLRGDTSLEERIKFDLYYIENWSLAFDIKILLMTLRATMKVSEVH